MQSIIRGNKEVTFANGHHYLILENLLIVHKWLIHNYIEKTQTAKETKQKQKFQKLQNENICLIYLKTKKNGNFHYLSFSSALLRVQKVKNKPHCCFNNLVKNLSLVRKMYMKSEHFMWHLIIFSAKIQLCI